MHGDKKKSHVVSLVERGGRIVAVAADNVGSKELPGIVNLVFSRASTPEMRGVENAFADKMMA